MMLVVDKTKVFEPLKELTSYIVGPKSVFADTVTVYVPLDKSSSITPANLRKLGRPAVRIHTMNASKGLKSVIKRIFNN